MHHLLQIQRNEGAVKADEIGTIFVKGQIDGLNGLSELDDEWTKPIVQEIEVVEKLMSQKNLFADANWDDGLTQWETDSSKDGVNVQLYPSIWPFTKIVPISSALNAPSFSHLTL